MQILQFLIVGLVAGWVMGKIRRGYGYGFFGNLFIGTLGSFIGWFLIGFLNVDGTNVIAQIAMAVMGAVIFFLMTGLIFRRRKKKSKKEDDDE